MPAATRWSPKVDDADQAPFRGAPQGAVGGEFEVVDHRFSRGENGPEGVPVIAGNAVAGQPDASVGADGDGADLPLCPLDLPGDQLLAGGVEQESAVQRAQDQVVSASAHGQDILLHVPRGGRFQPSRGVDLPVAGIAEQVPGPVAGVNGVGGRVIQDALVLDAVTSVHQHPFSIDIPVHAEGVGRRPDDAPGILRETPHRAVRHGLGDCPEMIGGQVGIEHAGIAGADPDVAVLVPEDFIHGGGGVSVQQDLGKPSGRVALEQAAGAAHKDAAALGGGKGTHVQERLSVAGRIPL